MTTPHDGELSQCRREVMEHEEAMTNTMEQRSSATDALEGYIAECQAAGREPDKDKLDTLTARRDGFVEDYNRSDRLWLRAKARLAELEAARQRWLVARGVFPPRRAYQSGPRPAA